MKLDWKNSTSRKTGMPTLVAELIPDVTIVFANNTRTKKQHAELRIDSATIAYRKPFIREMPDDDSIENAEKWILPQVLSHLNGLSLLAANAFQKGRTLQDIKTPTS